MGLFKNISRQFIFITMLMTTSAMVNAEPTGIVYTNNVDNPFDAPIFKIPKSLSEIVPEDYRKNWTRITGFEYSGLHWGQFVLVYMNKNTDIYRDNYIEYIRIYVEEEDVEEGEEKFKSYPAGTIFVKENYLNQDHRPGLPSSLTIMIKREAGYDPEFGDWQYIQSDVNGEIALNGRLKDKDIYTVCGQCHENMQERDYIFSTFLVDTAVEIE